MARVLQQIQQREVVLQKNEDILYQSDYKLRELQKALEQSESSREMINHELQMMIDEVPDDVFFFSPGG